MGFWDWLDPEGAERAAMLAAQEAPEIEAPMAKKPPVEGGLPRSDVETGGGAVYSAETGSPQGRMRTHQMIKQSGNPMAQDVLAQKDYGGADRSASGFIKAPSLGGAYGIDKWDDSWGMKGRAGQAISGLVSSIAPVVGGGLMGGREGAHQAWRDTVQARKGEESSRQKALESVASDKTMREGYEIARMNYEHDHNQGIIDLPFGDYLSQALQALQRGGTGTLNTLIDMLGPEEGLRRYEAMRASRGGGGAYETEYGIDPETGREFRRRRPYVSDTDLVGKVTQREQDGRQTVTRIGRDPLGDILK